MCPPLGPAPQSISTENLVTSLERELAAGFGALRRVTHIERRPSSYRSSFLIEDLDVRLDDGTALGLMFKQVGRYSALRDGRPVKPMFLHDPLREPLTYRNILGPRPLGTARCYGVLIDPGRGEYGVFLERVDGMPLCFVGEFGAWTAAARWLAGMHDVSRDEALPMHRIVPLLRYDRGFYQQWLTRALEYHESASGLVWLAARYHRVIERLEALPATLIHGEFYASNVLTQKTPQGLRICPVDWEMTAVGPGLIDLAALVAGQWTAEQRRMLAGAYHDGLRASGGGPDVLDELLEALEYCRLHLAVQLLGWAAHWNPPPSHRQDWLATAMELAETLRL